ncbi:hypothetical protein PINS_up004464 [Pythium insidiosum]|nr:hypothetical protein PINS_up004464 [Pythium insidiosum]
MMRHRAALRHQRNAAWVQEIVDRENLESSSSELHDQHSEEPSRVMLERQLHDSAERLKALEDSVASLQQSIERDHQTQHEVLASLHAMRTPEDVATCRERIQQELARRTNAAAKDVKVIKL